MEDNTKEDVQYRIIFLAQPTRYAVLQLREISEELRFMTTGHERMNEMEETLQTSLREFDPNRDAIIPIGRVTANLMIGCYLARKFPGSTITFGLHRWDSKDGYEWERIKV